MTPGFVGECAALGVLAGLGIIGALMARTAYTIIKDHRLGDVVRFTDLGANRVH